MTRCGFGLCPEPATTTVTSPTAIGHRVARLCEDHATRQRELDAELLARWASLGVLARKGSKAA